jgi:predicted TPR repeat methyltransferase
MAIPLPEHHDIDPNKPMSPADAVTFATRLHRLGQLEAAKKVYEAVLEAVPNHAAALQFYGILQHQLGKSEQAIELIRRCIVLAPGQAGPHMNLGNVLLETGDYTGAAQAYASANDLMPGNEELSNNLAILHRAQGQLDEAEALYRRALALKPDYIDAHNNLGHLLVARDRTDEALQHYFQALTLEPENVKSLRLLGLAYGSLGQLDKAAEVYRRWSVQEPHNPAPRHYLAACEQTDVPARADDDYVAQTFDQFAASFDAKLSSLQYRAPELIAQAVEALPHLPLKAKALRVLDAGCGTGLCGPLLAPHARELIGVDLSAVMLQHAEPRAVYDQLIKAELTSFLQSQPAAYELVVSADTLCYFGDLGEVSQAAINALVPGGWLVFSVESLPDEHATDYHLFPHGRYAHRPAYVAQALKAAGFAEVALAPVVLRMEAGKPVHGLIVQGHRT